MERLDLDKAFAPPPPIDNWPGVGHQPLKWITWRQESLIARLAGADEATVQEIMPQIMTALLPGRSWDEIQDVLDSKMMEALILECSREYHKAQQQLEAAVGNGVAGTAPASPPPTPSAPSSAELPASTAVPCGAS